MKTIPVSLVFAGSLLGAMALPAPPEGPDAPPVPVSRPEGRPEGGPGKRREGPPDEGGPGRPGGDEKRGRWRGDFWKRADANGDGVVSKEEFFALERISKLPEEKRNEIFARLDKDNDGKISKDELTKFGGGGPGKGVPRLPELDVDKSGGVSFEEFKASEFVQKLPPEKQEELFKRLDHDGDGQITPKDRPEPPKRPDGEGPDGWGPRQMLKRLDADGDGAVTFEEFKKAPFAEKLGEDALEDRFEKMDRNHDKKLTAEDFPPKPDGPPGEHPDKPDRPEKPDHPQRPGPPPAPSAE